jgi:hypothetical protein
MVRRFLWALTARFTRAMGCSNHRVDVVVVPALCW